MQESVLTELMKMIGIIYLVKLKYFDKKEQKEGRINTKKEGKYENEKQRNKNERMKREREKKTKKRTKN